MIRLSVRKLTARTQGFAGSNSTGTRDWPFREALICQHVTLPDDKAAKSVMAAMAVHHSGTEPMKKAVGLEIFGKRLEERKLKKTRIQSN